MDSSDDESDERQWEPSVVSVKSSRSIDVPFRFRDAEKESREKSSESPDCSFVSIRSEMSMGIPLKFGQSDSSLMGRYEMEQSSSSGPSMDFWKSHKSMVYSVSFQDKGNENEEPRTSLPSTMEMDSLGKHLSSDCTISQIRVMDHQTRTLELKHFLNMFKSKQQKKFQTVNEGIIIHGNSKLLNDIYTELYITSDVGWGHISDQHEIRHIQRAYRRPMIEGSIHCNDIFRPSPGDDTPIRTVLTEGVAGIGKTMSVQKFVLDWAEGKANQDLDLVFRFSFRELNFIRRDLSLLELLHWIFPETKKIKLDYHLSKIMFIFDGLDESNFSLDLHNSLILSDITESASVDVLLINLIKGNLLPSALLWITSRPAASSQIPPDYISRITEVRGFDDLGKEEYLRKRISDQTLAGKILSHLKSSRSLYIMCHIPVFCWITATVLEEMFCQAETQEVPKTLTQMFTHFLVIQIKRGSQKYRQCAVKSGEITEIVLKLGKLAFQQLEKGKLVFYEEDITECGIGVKEATVYSGVCTQIFIEEVTSQLGKVYTFVHLSVQEHLAAVYAFLSFVNRTKQQTTEIFGLHNKAPLIDLLKKALNKALKSKNGHLDLFLRFLMGLSVQSNSNLLQCLLKETAHSYLKKNAEATKKEIITYIEKKIETKPIECRYINLFHCLIELNDQTLVKEAQAILSKTTSFHELKPNRAQWSALVFSLMNSEGELEEFTLQKYEASDECLMNMHPVITAFRKALLCDSNLTSKSCESLAKVLNLECSSLRELDLSDNKLQDSGVKLLSKALKSQHCKLEVLRLGNCDLTEKSCKVLASVLTSKSTCLIELDLSRNKLQDSGVKQLSGALGSPDCKIETLRPPCSRVKKIDLRVLDAGRNKAGQTAVELLSDLLKHQRCELQTLKLFGCGITLEGGTHLISALISNPSHLKQLDLGCNKVGDQGMKFICDFLKNDLCKLEILRLRKCDITKEGCVALTAALSSKSSLKELDLSANDLGEQELKLLSDIQKDEKFTLETFEL